MPDTISSLAAAATASSATTQQSRADKDAASFTADFESFLKLFVTQLENQDPLEPQDSSDFTAQIAQFSQVEQTVQTNKNLEKILAASANDNNASLVSYSGKSVELEGDTISIATDGAENTFHYNLDTPAREAFVEIRDSDGNIVFNGQAITDAGENYLTWDGSDTEGNPAPAGSYAVKVSIRDQDGNLQDVPTIVKGKVDGVDLSGAEPTLLVNGKNIALSDINFVGEA